MAEIICIVCPKSCRITVGDDLAVTGNLCKRGETYAREERTSPVRTVTSTVRINGAMLRRCPVRSSTPIPKQLIRDSVRLLDSVTLTAPVKEGDSVIENICGTGIRFITTRSMSAT